MFCFYVCVFFWYMHIYVYVKFKSSNEIFSLILFFKMCFSLTSTLHKTSLVTDSIARHYECLQAHENEELLKHYFTVETQDRSNKSGKVWVLQKHIKEVENLERSLQHVSIFLPSVSLQVIAYMQDVHVFSVYIIHIIRIHMGFWRWGDISLIRSIGRPIPQCFFNFNF